MTCWFPPPPSFCMLHVASLFEFPILPPHLGGSHQRRLQDVLGIWILSVLILSVENTGNIPYYKLSPLLSLLAQTSYMNAPGALKGDRARVACSHGASKSEQRRSLGHEFHVMGCVFIMVLRTRNINLGWERSVSCFLSTNSAFM